MRSQACFQTDRVDTDRLAHPPDFPLRGGAQFVSRDRRTATSHVRLLFRERAFSAPKPAASAAAYYGREGDTVSADFERHRYFQKFNLLLPGPTPNQRSRFHRLNYDTLAPEDQTTFNLRTIRNVIIKQNAPEEEGDTSVFEIFYRLNTGGVNLRPQEIRTSLYHSDFMDALKTG